MLFDEKQVILPRLIFIAILRTVILKKLHYFASCQLQIATIMLNIMPYYFCRTITLILMTRN